jgi:hypothetical protein
MLIGLLLFTLVSAGLLAIPEIRRAAITHKAPAVVMGLTFLGVLFVHPYVFGLPGRIAEMRFQEQLRPGISRLEALRLARQYGGKTPYFSDLRPYIYGPNGESQVWFVDWVSLCVVDGNVYSVYFSPSSKLTSWKVDRLGNAC